ncbi:MAG: HEAT repeat domain-containing protein [Myxococcota bacterium]
MELLMGILVALLVGTVATVIGGVFVLGLVVTRTRQWLFDSRTRRILDQLPVDMTYESSTERASLDRPGSDRSLWITPGASARPTLWTDEASGDRAFDAEVRVSAAPERLRALLDADTRGAIRTLVRAGGSVEGGVVLVGLATTDADVTAWRVAMVRSVADRIATMRPDELPDRTATIAREDPDPTVRYLALEAYCATGRDVGPLAAVLLRDPDPRVRARAARHAGPPGVPVLAELRAHELPEVRRLALHGSASLPNALRLLRDHVADGVAVAEALLLTGDPAIEAPLIALLASDERDTRDAACVALGQVGTVAAVEALLACKSAAGHAAVALIHERIGPRERGALSLAPVTGGEVSVAAHVGAVSLPVGSGK